jgi:hypothetical protein
LAAIYQWSVWLEPNERVYVTDMRRVLAGEGAYGAQGSGQYYVGPWWDTGFRAEMRDDGDQVQHFARSMEYQASGLFWNYGSGAINWTEGEAPDRALNHAVGFIAHRVQPTTRGNRSWSMIQDSPTFVRDGFLDHIFDPAEVGPAPGTFGRPPLQKRD